jgi:cytoskeletal protein CcmA (bactofilin family)
VVTGRIEGRISLEGYALTIAPTGSVEADIRAGIAIVGGQLKGNVAATDKVEIRDGGAVDGDILTPRIAIADGALVRGRIDMPPEA